MPIDIYSLPTFQGRNQNTFKHPPFEDDSLNIHELFAYHAVHSPQHPTFVYADDEKKCHYVYYPETYAAVRNAAKIIGNNHRGHTPSTQPVVAILANVDTITYFAFTVGVMYNGFTPFPISTRNSAEAVAHLVRSTNVTHIYVSADAANQRLAQSAAKILSNEGTALEMLSMPLFENLFNGTDCEDVKLVKVDPSTKHALILHSSGSTNLPKPIKFTHKNFIKWDYGDLDICGKVLASQSLPMFHAMGAVQLLYTSCIGVIMGCFKPSNPPIFPVPEVFLEAIVATQANIVFCVPSHAEAWSRDPNNLPALRGIDTIIYAGAPLNDKVGTSLTAAGVKLTALYGTTEIGSLSKFVIDPNRPNADWRYFELSPDHEIKKVFREDRPELFEPIVKSTEKFSPHVLNATADGVPGFATSDLLEVHPTNPALYRIYGRADDQLILSTGENTNPAPMESIMLQNPDISAVIMFGHGRFQNGVLIQPTKDFDVENETLLSEYRNKIWPSVEKANNFAPTFSRIMKEMILVTKPSKPMEFTAKGTPRRQYVLNKYANEIDALYDAVMHSSQPELTPPDVWAEESTLEFVRHVVKNVLGHQPPDSADLFDQGCDSLKATWIRNTLTQSLRTTTTIPVHTIPSSFVYSNPTIQALTSLLLQYVSLVQKDGSEEEIVKRKVGEMQKLLEKYDRFTPPSGSTKVKIISGRAVLVTGTTGCFGSHILAQLLVDSMVEKIFALNRTAAVPIMNRQRTAFDQWGLDTALLESEKLVLLVGDTKNPSFGLDATLYKEIEETVTNVIHNAWLVDFNRSLSSFELLIEGVQKLIDFSLVSGSQFTFVSSIAVIYRHDTDAVVIEDLVPAQTAVGNGYGESKWVAEQLVASARKKGLTGNVARVGQLCGDTRKGAWNPKEWAPSIVLSGKLLGCLPTRNQNLHWLPVDVAASALLQLADAQSYENLIYHLVAPHPAQWDAIFSTFATELSLPLVPYSEWLARLEAKESTADSRVNAFHLLDFYRVGVDIESRISLSTTRAELASSTLKQSSPPNATDVRRYLTFWSL